MEEYVGKEGKKIKPGMRQSTVTTRFNVYNWRPIDRWAENADNIYNMYATQTSQLKDATNGEININL